MNIDDLADLLKERGCGAVCYFHTDHFEPWSTNIDEASARAVDRMASLARSSPYARRLSLFYSVFVPYRLIDDSTPAVIGDEQAAGDAVAFGERSARQEDLAREAIRPLVTADGHEMHLHVHPEFWTRNHSHFDNPVSRWVNASSTPELDEARLDLNFRLCKETIARETGAPFERWGFIHGNWALNASDPLICHVSSEMAIIMRHGGFGDFSFPAGRSYCDPEMKAPFTCLPLDLVRAYDDPRADPRPVGDGTRVMRSDRFFIWNGPIKSVDSSLDYYSAANRKLFETPERVVANWLRKSVVLGGQLFLKTHAHSMNGQYRLSEPDGTIPHCYPDIVKVFDCLSRVCERAGVELRFQTVNEVVRFLAERDGGDHALLQAEDGAAGTPAADTPAAEPPPATTQAVADELLEMHRTWMQLPGVTVAPDDLYAVKVSHGSPFETYEIALADEIASRYPAATTRVVEIGVGWGGLAVLLARRGFEVLGFEGNAARYAACRWHFAEQIKRYPALAGRLLTPRDGLFPEVYSDSVIAKDKINICIATNITHSYSAEHQEDIAQTATAFDEFIIDLARFGQTRDQQSERDELLRMLTRSAFRPLERVFFNEPYEYWRFQSRSAVQPQHPDAVSTPASSGNSLFPLHGQHGLLFSQFGDRHLAECPVCGSQDHALLWRMPATHLPDAIEVFGGYFNQVPTLQVPGLLYSFDYCRDCESIFLNPVPTGQKEEYRTSEHYIRKMRTPAEWHEYETIYDKFAPWIPSGSTIMIDAACGLGQYLHVARRRGLHHWRRLIGLELAEKYVENMRSEGFEAHVFDIDDDDLPGVVPSDSVDFIAFCEAFEHVERPLDALRKLLAALRPAGRLFFTAQRYGKDVQAAVRPGEPIYIGEKLLDELPQRLGCRIVDVTTSTMRYYVVLEK